MLEQRHVGLAPDASLLHRPSELATFEVGARILGRVPLGEQHDSVVAVRPFKHRSPAPAMVGADRPSLLEGRLPPLEVLHFVPHEHVHPSEGLRVASFVAVLVGDDHADLVGVPVRADLVLAGGARAAHAR